MSRAMNGNRHRTLVRQANPQPQPELPAHARVSEVLCAYTPQECCGTRFSREGGLPTRRRRSRVTLQRQSTHPAAVSKPQCSCRQRSLAAFAFQCVNLGRAESRTTKRSAKRPNSSETLFGGDRIGIQDGIKTSDRLAVQAASVPRGLRSKAGVYLVRDVFQRECSCHDTSDQIGSGFE